MRPCRSVLEAGKGSPKEPEEASIEEEEEEEAEGAQGREEGASHQQDSPDQFPQLLDDDDLRKAIDIREGLYDDEGLEFRPRLTSVVTPSLSSTPPPSQLSSPTWSEEELQQQPREGSSVSSSASSHRSYPKIFQTFKKDLSEVTVDRRKTAQAL